MNTIEILRTALDLLHQHCTPPPKSPCIKTFSIGMEPNISGDAYPIARIVLERETHYYQARGAVCMLYLGDKIPIHLTSESQLEAVTAMADSALAALRMKPDWRVNRVGDVIFDEDRVPAFKLAGVRLEIISQ
jgi:hypothetical protein